MRKFAVIVALLAVAPLAMASTVYLNEDFESYADTADMQTVWGAAGLGTLDTAFAFSGSQSMAHPGGTDNIFALGADLIPSDAEPVVLRGVIYDDGSGNKRTTIGFRSLSTFPLFEMGMYNTSLNYSVRINTFPGLSPNWVDMDFQVGANEATVGWHTFEATFTGTDITVTLDLNSDGSIESTNNWVLGGAYTTGLGVVRLGGPSNGTSTSGVNYDDIYVAQIPEPAGLLLLGLGALAIRRR